MNRWVVSGRGGGRLAAAGAFVVSLVVGACTAGGAKPLGAASTVATTTSTTTAAQLQAAIVGQWLLAQQTLAALQKDPTASAQVLLLADYVTEPLLSFSRNQFAARARDGLADLGTIDFGHPRVVTMTASQATVVSCVNDGFALVVLATGKPLAGTNPNPALEATTSMMVVDPSGTWKLSDSVIKVVTTCTGV